MGAAATGDDLDLGPMFRQNRFLPLLAVGLLVAGGACSDSTGGNDSQVQLSLQPQFPASYTPGSSTSQWTGFASGLIRPPAEAVVDTLVPFPADATELNVRIRVPLLSRREILNASLEMSAGTQVLFSGTREIEVTDVSERRAGDSAPVCRTGTLMTSLRIEPRDSALRPGQAFTYRILAFSGPNALEDFYVGWSTDDPTGDVNANGALVAPDERGSFLLRVVSPTGFKDSTRVWISPPATGMAYTGGDEQTSAVGTQLPGLLIVRVMAHDGLGVPGVPVRFTALSGGTVREPVILTDAEGFARNTVTLGPIAGPAAVRGSTAVAADGDLPRERAGRAAVPDHRPGRRQPAGHRRTASPQRADRAGERRGWKFHRGRPGHLAGRERRRRTGADRYPDQPERARPRDLSPGHAAGHQLVRVTVNGPVADRGLRRHRGGGPASVVEVVSGDEQTGLPGATLTPFTVQVTDEFGNPLPGVTVRWTVLDGGGTLGARNDTTDIAGRTSVTYQLPSLPGAAHIRAQVASNGVGPRSRRPP